MDPQRFPAAKRILLSTKEPPPGLASHLRKVKVDESRASAPRKISSLPENFTRQAGSTTVPNARSRHGLTQVSVPAHTPLPPLAGPSSIAPMAKPSLKRPRTSQPEATPVLAEVKPEDRPTATAVPPSTKRPRKHVRRALVPETIKWMVVKTLSSPPTSPPTRGGSRGGRGRGAGRGRGRGRGRGGAGMMSEPVLPHNTTQASPVALVDVSDESATQASDSQQFKPRQWSSSKEELFAILPGLGHNVNGIATEIFETPIVFLDGTNGISISNTCRIPNIGMDITMSVYYLSRLYEI
ncbi:hypothetical protein B0H16DRAFT_1505614 [Mycena metata]|uniref:Uncharacterized protein n=1 Tax=Mycena metata TaxID=1033252 RepID=A0AAD7K3R3_9AGAR|nr:hypothetical protein B0H16DRAFT_1505614 [Mycena metata]